jgi:ATP-binding cassette subfamily F protein uup
VLLVSHDRDFLDRVVTSVIAAEGNGRWIEYAGGFTDMLAQRPASGWRVPPYKAITKQPARPLPSTPQQTAPRQRRMSFKDRHALEMLPTQIASLQDKIAALDVLLADPEFYARDPDGFRQTITALASAKDKLAAAEEQWLTLELRREELEAAERKP